MNNVVEFSYVFGSFMCSLIIKLQSTWCALVITVSAHFNWDLLKN